ncbi:uncharacterized protein A4U43_C04F11140 [Asparagus officinalis]|uniref:Uncharacterized protein n=1 Tax=Asparagus officinalis TaxID=4686 RepID=A0A5P1F5C5_ASPOF|nr:uncharacterized protein A4U43_C04F11140 [Asparagus officinalis]
MKGRNRKEIVIWRIGFGARTSTRSKKMLTRVAEIILSTYWTKAYEKLPILNETDEQELISFGVDTNAIKADIEKGFAKQKQEREENDEEFQIEIERKDDVEKEDNQDKEMKEVKDDMADMSIEVEEITLTQIM